VGVEDIYGEVPAITKDCRFPAVRLATRQVLERPQRRDKAGTRTFRGDPPGSRRKTKYELRTYLTGWSDPSRPPAYGPLFEAALGSPALVFAGGTIASASTAVRVSFSGLHGLSAGQAIAVAGEMRFVSAIIDSSSVEVNAPFSVVPPAGAAVTPTVTYFPNRSLKSVSIFDYWSPESSIQRLVRGAAVDDFRLKVNADYHEFEFRGPACDVIDNATFADGDGALGAYPTEPDVQWLDQTIIPGHLGQVWLGAASKRFYTLTRAELQVRNNLETRVREFGCDSPRGVIPGERDVSIDFELYAADDEQTKALYEASRQRSPIRALFQLGQATGQMFGVYMKSVVPELPDFNDGDRRLSWGFTECRAQGSGEDEVVLAFG
jgi:hypothetical protein